MNKRVKSIPKFRSEAEERQFWETRDSSEYIGWSKAERVRFPKSKAIDDCEAEDGRCECGDRFKKPSSSMDLAL